MCIAKRPSLSEAMVAICSADWKSSPFPQDSLREASESWTVALQTPAWDGRNTYMYDVRTKFYNF